MEDYEAPVAHVMLWDSSAIGPEIVIDYEQVAVKSKQIRLATSAYEAVTKVKETGMIGFLIGSNDEFDAFDRGILQTDTRVPTLSSRGSVMVFQVDDNEIPKNQEKMFVYNRLLNKISYFWYIKRHKLQLTPINNLRFALNGVYARIKNTVAEYGWLAVTRSRRCYLLRREATEIRLSGLWVMGNLNDKLVFDACVSFHHMYSKERNLLCLFDKNVNFYEWQLIQDMDNDCFFADFRFTSGYWSTAQLTKLCNQKEPEFYNRVQEPTCNLKKENFCNNDKKPEKTDLKSVTEMMEKMMIQMEKLTLVCNQLLEKNESKERIEELEYSVDSLEYMRRHNLM